MTTPYTGPEIEAAVKMIKEDSILAGHQAIVERMEKMEQRLSRMPVQEMTAEEKAAAYDKLMAEKNNPPKDPPKDDPKPGPVPPDPKPPVPPTPPRKDPFWGDRLNG